MAQSEYVEWKHEMLAPFANKIATTGNGIGFDTIPMNQLAWLHEAAYLENGGRTVSDELIEQLDERAIAAWYCDDGSFSGNYKRWGHGKSQIYNSHPEPTLTSSRLADRCERLGWGGLRSPTASCSSVASARVSSRRRSRRTSIPRWTTSSIPTFGAASAGIRTRATPI